MSFKSLKLFSVFLVIFITLTGDISEARRWRQKTNYHIRRIPKSANSLSEGPHWDSFTQSMYYVGINNATILRYSYFEDKIYRAKVLGEEFASFIIPVEGTFDQFAVGCGRKVKIVQWNGYCTEAVVIRTLFEVEADDYRYSGNRFNDGKCDSRGRLFAGTMHYKTDPLKYRRSSLYKYEPHSTPMTAIADVGISNGLAWNDKLGKLYFSDTADLNIKEFDYDLETGTIDTASSRTVLDLRHEGNLLLDGMTIDTEGNIYVASYNGSAVYKTNPRTKKVLSKITMPCLHVTSMAFGGPFLNTLFVTTANEENEPNECGHMYKVTGLNAKGFKPNKIKIY